MEQAHHNVPEAKMTSSNYLICAGLDSNKVHLLDYGTFFECLYFT